MDYEDREEKSVIIRALLPVWLTAALLITIFTIHFCLQVRDEQAVKRITTMLSSMQSSIEVQPTTVSLFLPTESFVYGTNGGAVVGDSLMSFNTGSNELSFRVSYPNGNKQKSFPLRLNYLARVTVLSISLRMTQRMTRLFRFGFSFLA